MTLWLTPPHPARTSLRVPALIRLIAVFEPWQAEVDFVPRVHRQIRPSCQSARAVSGKCVVRKAETEQVRETVGGKHRQTEIH